MIRCECHTPRNGQQYLEYVIALESEYIMDCNVVSFELSFHIRGQYIIFQRRHKRSVVRGTAVDRVQRPHLQN